MPSQQPFRPRNQPDRSRKRKSEQLTVGDRLICGLCGAALGFVLWTMAYFLILTGTARASIRNADLAGAADWPPPYGTWGGTIAVGFAAFGMLVGPERMMNGFEAIARLLGRFFGHRRA